MSNTETSGVVNATEGLTVTVPSDPAPDGALAVVMHTPVVCAATTQMASPVACSTYTHQAMVDVPSGPGDPVTSADQL